MSKFRTTPLTKLQNALYWLYKAEGKKMDTSQMLFSLFFPLVLLAIARLYRARRERQAAEAATAAEPVELSPLGGLSPRGEAFCRGEAPWQLKAAEPRAVEPWLDPGQSRPDVWF